MNLLILFDFFNRSIFTFQMQKFKDMDFLLKNIIIHNNMSAKKLYMQIKSAV